MNHLPLLAEIISNLGVVAVAVVGIVIVIIVFMAVWASRYTKVGPNQVLVVSGRKHAVVGPDGTVAIPRLPHRQRRRHASSFPSSKRWTSFRSNC